jgi:hypothetical protein
VAEAMSPHVISGKDLERYWQQHDALRAFHEMFNERETVDERAVAIVGATFLDDMLEHMLVTFMVDDEKEKKSLIDGPLGTFSARVTATYCLGLVCKTVRDDLRTVGKIRNKFAHQLEVSFDVEPIRCWCRSLKWHEFSMMTRTPADATPLEIFKVSVNQLICYLSGRVTLHDRRKVSSEDDGPPTLLR